MKPAVTVRPVVNCYLDDGGKEILLQERTSDGGSKQRRIPAEYVSWHLQSELDGERMRQLKSLGNIKSIRIEKEFVRIGWTDEWGRRSGLKGMRHYEVETFEGDVDPVLLYLVESKCEIAKPRRAYLDLEADSNVPLSRKEDMRILSWAIADEKSEYSMVLEEDDDDAERALLEALYRKLLNYDQIVVWEGDWKGGEFDSVVLPHRWRKRGLPVDDRRWLWLNQLAVWKRMNMHSAESGAEKESFKLEDIAHEQIGKGKEPTPDFVRERFGEKCDRGLGAITRELYDAGGKFRKLLETYNVRDAVLLRELEDKKGYITIFQALCEVSGVIPVTRSLNPTRQMDGFMLRLGRERGHRFPTRKWFEDEEEEDKGKFKGAVVFHPKTVASNKDEGEFVWSDEDARRWRLAHGLRNGILRNVHVCDFKSLYPSVMQTWNLSADVVVGWANNHAKAVETYGEGVCHSPGTNLVTSTKVTGILPLALTELLRLRGEFADLAASLPPGSPEWQNAMAKSTAYKVAANSFYGAGGSPYSRFNNRDVSEACTQNSVHLLRMTAEQASCRDMIAVYADTDSLFVTRPTEDGFRSFVKWLNVKKFPAEIKASGCAINNINLTFEKTFDRLVFVTAKAYVGRFLSYKGTPSKRECHGHVFEAHKGEKCPECKGIGKIHGEPEIKGLAYKRGDRGKLAREMQGRILDCLVGGVKVRNKKGEKVAINADRGYDTPTEDLSIYRGIIEKMRDHVLADTLDITEVRMSNGISKPLREYAKEGDGSGKRPPAHVIIARQLVERGQSIGEGSRIEYVIVDGEKSPMVVIPAEDYNGEYDRFHLWEKIYRPTMFVLQAAFPDIDWVSYESVRPPKPKGRKKVDARQFGFGFDTPKPTELNRVSSNDDLAVPVYRSTPIDIHIPEEAGLPAVDRVNEVLRAHPGGRTVQIVIELKTGSRAILKTALRVSPSDRLKEEVEEAIRPTDAS